MSDAFIRRFDVMRNYGFLVFFSSCFLCLKIKITRKVLLFTFAIAALFSCNLVGDMEFENSVKYTVFLLEVLMKGSIVLHSILRLILHQRE